ncbi:MAG: tyrosine-type recombinase/integrase, partial [Gemmataceae bacterium]
MSLNPLAHLSRGKTKLDQRKTRRALTVLELQTLLTTSGQSSKVFRGFTGDDRRVLYKLAASTGFRAEELASLTPSAFQLDSKPYTVTLAGKNSKNKKTAVQPLIGEVVEDLRLYLATRDRTEVLWPGTWFERAADMIRRDLKAASIESVSTGPVGKLHVDFHSLRHTFISLLDQSGATLKEAMQLARHSDPKLTMAVYGRVQLNDLAERVGQLPGFGDDSPNRDSG